MLAKDKILEVAPVTSGVVITGTGAVALSTIINVALLALLVLQLGYVTWKWRRDWVRHKRAKTRIKRMQECGEDLYASRKPPERRREDCDG